MADAERAAQLFNQAWDHLEQDQRTEAEDVAMVTAALESRQIWRSIGTPKNHAISDWQMARIYSELGQTEPALAFASLSLRLCEEHDLGPFLTGYAHEAIARAHAVAGAHPLARRHIHQATIMVGRIGDEAERKLLDDDLAAVEALLP